MSRDAAADECMLDRLTPQERGELKQTLTRVLDVMDDVSAPFAPERHDRPSVSDVSRHLVARR